MRRGGSPTPALSDTAARAALLAWMIETIALRSIPPYPSAKRIQKVSDSTLPLMIMATEMTRLAAPVILQVARAARWPASQAASEAWVEMVLMPAQGLRASRPRAAAPVTTHMAPPAMISPAPEITPVHMPARPVLGNTACASWEKATAGTRPEPCVVSRRARTELEQVWCGTARLPETGARHRIGSKPVHLTQFRALRSMSGIQ